MHAILEQERPIQAVVDDATQIVDIDATQIVDQSLEMEAVRPGALVKPKKGLSLPLLITIAVVVIGLGIGGYIFYNNYLSVEKAGVYFILFQTDSSQTVNRIIKH